MSIYLDFFESGTLYGLLVLGFYLLAIRNIWHIIASEMNPSAAITWILVNIAIPFLGVPLYLFLGQTRLRRYTHLRRGQTTPNLKYPSESTLNHIEPLTSGTAAFPQIFEDLDQAKEFILVQYYIFRTDRLGLSFIDRLIEKAKEGVKVFFIYDNLGSLGLTGQHTRRMKKNGIYIARFLPFTFRFNLQINFRNHRKVIVVDGKVAFLGGMNVGMEYLGLQRHWRDTQIRIEGAAVYSILQTFADDWYFASPLNMQGKLDSILTSQKPLPFGDMKSRVYAFGPGDPYPLGLYLFIDLIQSAKSSISIATPYFIPDLILERCLELALKKGVRVDMLVPKKTDSRTIHFMNRHYCRRIQSHGANVYLYEPGFMHQKVLMVDDQNVLIGTSNFDNRSIYLNFETCVLVENETFSRWIKDMLDGDFANSSLLETKSMSRTETIIGNILRLASPLF